jgi:aldehyde:ferredoxin oxidoreductase
LIKEDFNAGLSAAGTGGGVSFLVGNGDTPIKNWTQFGVDAMPTCTNLDAGNMDPYKVSGYGCHACPVRCGAMVNVSEGPFKTESEVGRPEYETLAALGTMCFNDNVEAVIRANEICNRYGLDTMNAGGTVAFAMECYEKGLISKEETDGIELNFGNAEAMVSIVEKMAKREGFGAVLADGVKKAAEQIGKGSEAFAIHVGGQTLPYHDPRVNPCQGVSYMSEPNPARHMESQGTIALEHGRPLIDNIEMAMPDLEYYGDYDAKGPMYAIGAQHYQFYSSAGLCSLFVIAPTHVPVAECVSAVTGWDMDWAEALQAGKRIQIMRYAFNAREGFKPTDFTLPERLTTPQPVGESQGVVADWETAKSGYFQALGIDYKSGKPYPATLHELGIGELTNDLW